MRIYVKNAVEIERPHSNYQQDLSAEIKIIRFDAQKPLCYPTA